MSMIERPFRDASGGATRSGRQVSGGPRRAVTRRGNAVLVHVDDAYAMCVLPASYKLDMAKVAEAVNARSVRLADETEMAKIFPDVEVGAEPPFGSLYDLRTVVDEHLAGQEELIFQAGTHRDAIRMRYADYASLVKPAVADLAVQR